ncbi:hypothetical protein ACFLWN_04245 [Chloroflexota bacterium]
MMAKPQAVRPGYYAAIGLVPEMAPANCYIGLIMAADEYGVRINLVHWDGDLDVVARETEDLFLPWESITTMLVCNEDQPSRRFLAQRAPAWRNDIERMISGTKVKKSGGTKKEQ